MLIQTSRNVQSIATPFLTPLPIFKRLPTAILDSPQALAACVLPDIDPKWGGPSVSVPALCRAMHAQDARVRLYFATGTFDSGWPAFFQGFAKSYGGLLHASSGLRAALATGSFRVVHHHALWLPSLGYAYRAARAARCPLVISPRGMLAAYALRRARLKKWLAAKLLHPGALVGAAAWHATSDMELADIRAAGFRQPALVSANGIEVPAWHEAADRELWFEHYPELRGKRVALFYSRLHSKKGILPLLDMWSQIESRHPDWHLLVAGSAHEYTLAQLAERARRIGLRQRVTFADPAGLAKPYRLAQLYLLPTLSENFGLTIGEALASAVPVLTTTEAPWQRVNDLGCGACVPLEPFQAAWVRLMAESDEALARRGQIGEQWMADEFSWAAKAREMLDFYRQLTGQ